MRSFKTFAIAISLFVPNFLTSEAIDTSGLQRATEIQVQTEGHRATATVEF